MIRLLIVPVVLVLAGCELVQPEIRIGAAQGIPSVSGTAEVELAAFVCGNPISAGAYTVTTRPAADGCELAFDKDIEVVAATDYEKISELSKASALLQSVELKITRLAFTDAQTNLALDPSTRMKSAAFSINGQLMGDKDTLTALPKTVTLQGAALAPLKASISQRQAAIVRASSVVVLPDSPPPPKKLRIEYDAQPTLVLGTGEIK